MNYENAADMAISLKQVEEALQLYDNAAEMFSANGNIERSGDSLAKAAKALETEAPARALKLYLDAVERYESEELSYRKAVETLRKAVNLTLNSNKLDEAIHLLDRQAEIQQKSKQKADLPKTYLSLLVVYIANNDVVAASKAYNTFLSTEGFTQTKECLVGGQLLDAFENGSADGLKNCINQQVFNFLPNQITKLARNLSVAGSAGSGGSRGGEGEKEKGDDARGNEEEDDLSILL